MIGVVGFKNMMMHQRVALEGISELSQRPVHDVTVQRPLKQRGVNHGDDKTDRRPKEKRGVQGKEGVASVTESLVIRAVPATNIVFIMTVSPNSPDFTGGSRRRV
jgi:hypothetical protein